MATITRPRGIQITLPEGYELELPVPPATRRRRVSAAAVAPPNPENAVLVKAFEGSDMELLDSFELRPVTGGSSERRGVRGTSEGPAEVVVELTEDENAVILLEQDGFYSWQFPTERGSPVPRKGGLRRGRESIAARRVRFSFMVAPVAPAPTKRGMGKRGVISDIGDFIIGKAKAYVLKFAAKFAVNTAMKMLEKNVTEGLVSIRTTDTSKWTYFDDISALKLPAGRQPRVLLLIHGTFSSTIGCFGALAATEKGKEFLKSAWKNYDAVIGYDHATLSVDPAANATDLLKRLRRLGWNVAPRFDIITHSRGALVSRILAEQLIPRSRWGMTVEHAVFVAGTNGGTLLAEPDNWHALIDLYTNLLVASCKVIGLFPQAKTATAVLSEVAKGLGAFIKYSATYAVTEKGVPGLAAMEPDSVLVADINESFPAQTGRYYTITSDFKPRVIGGKHEPRELPLRLVQWLADGAIDRLMKEGNDLVVNTSSMSIMEELRRGSIVGKLDFGENPEIYHTNYFAAVRVIEALTEWLGGDMDVEPRVPTVRTRSTHLKLKSVDPMMPKAQIDFALPAIVEKRSRGSKQIRRIDAYSADTLDGRDRSNLGGFVGRSTEKNVTKVGEPIVSYDRGGVRKARSMRDAIAPIRASKNPGRGVGLGFTAREVPAKQSAPKKNPKGGISKKHVSKSAAKSKGASTKNVLCNFHALMDEEVLLGRATAVEVRLSREEIAVATGRASRGGQGEIDPNKKITIQLIPKQNFEVMGLDRFEIQPPEPGTPCDLVFNVRATHKGDGVIWVDVRQNQLPLITLVLNTKIVARRGKGAGKVSIQGDAVEQAPPPKPLDQLQIVELITGSQVVYRFQLDSAQLGGVSQYHSNPLIGDREKYVATIYGEIEKKWLSNKDDIKAFTAELRAYGGQLFRQLFPVELQRVLWKNRKKLKEIMVISTEPFIPWELVHLRDPDTTGLPKETLFLGQMGLVRWLFNVMFPSPKMKIRKGRARYVIPHYIDERLRLPEAEEEESFLKEHFRAKTLKAEPNAVRELIENPGAFDLLHFACHGEAEGENILGARLLLQDREEDGEIIPTSFSATVAGEYAQLRGGDNAPMVVLNACQIGRAGYALTNIGGFAQAFIHAGAGVFIGTLWSVGDKPARTFTEKLYLELRNGATLAEATVSARAAARKAKNATWLAYVVYGLPYMKLVR